jgi:hypothetical protein
MLRCSSIGHHIFPHYIFRCEEPLVVVLLSILQQRTQKWALVSTGLRTLTVSGCKLFAYVLVHSQMAQTLHIISLHDVSISVYLVYFNTFEV